MSTENRTIVTRVDNVLVQCHGGWLDVLHLIDRVGDKHRIHTDATTGTTTVQNNHQRYLMYRAGDTIETPNGPKIQHHRVIAPIGADGKTFVEEGRNYNLIGFTDAKIASLRRLGAWNVDDPVGGEKTESTSPAKREQKSHHQEGNNGDEEFPSRDVSPSNMPLAAATSPVNRLNYLPSMKRSYVRRTKAPRKDSAYQIFLKLFMASNAGQKPTFKDGAEVWRSLSKEEQAKYAIIDSSSSQSSERPALRVELATSTGKQPDDAVGETGVETGGQVLTTPEDEEAEKTQSPSERSRKPKRSRASNPAEASLSNEDMSPLVTALDSETQKRSRKERK